MIIPNGVDIDKFSLKRKGSYLDKYLKNAIYNKKVIFVGQVSNILSTVFLKYNKLIITALILHFQKAI